MITEDYVSFEVAKLLREKGFDIECNTAYYNGSLIDYTMYGFCIDGEFIFAPTHQMAMKWLREVYDIFIKLEFDVDEDIQWHPSLALIKGNKHIHTNELQWYDTYEHAVGAAIKYCLENLI